MKVDRSVIIRRAVALPMVALLVLVVLGMVGLARVQHVVEKVPVEERVIALTFDDGPHPEYTSRMLDELESRGLSATFFVVGQEAEKHPAILKRIVAAGHEVGNHTYTHDFVELLDTDAFAAEVGRCDAVIASVTGDGAAWYRAPRGRLPFAQRWSVRRSGKRAVGWSRCLEAGEFRDPLALAAALEPGDIVLVHDGRLDRSSSVEMLPAFLDAAVERGFRFVTVSELDTMRVTGISAGLIPTRP